MAKPKSTPRNKMDEPQVSKLILDIITTEDPKEKAKLKALNQPPNEKKSYSRRRTKKK